MESQPDSQHNELKDDGKPRAYDEPQVYNAHSLNELSVKVVARLFKDHGKDGQLKTIIFMARAVPAVIKSAERAMRSAHEDATDRRLKDLTANLQCVNWAGEFPLLSHSQRESILRLLLQSHAILLPLLLGSPPLPTDKIEDVIVTLLKTTAIYPKYMLAQSYNLVSPLKDLVRDRRSEILADGVFKTIARFGRAVGEKRFKEDYVQAFGYYVNGNPKHIMKTELELCHGCDEKLANVVTRKHCNGDACSSCRCRPIWCSGCMAHVFLAADHSTYSQARCCTCRATICISDVLLVINESSASSQSAFSSGCHLIFDL